MLFIDVNDWDEKAYGPLEESKVVEEKIGGKTIRGIYKFAGKKGHYDVRSFENRAARVETEEHSRSDAKELFAQEALKNKTEAVQAVLQESQRDREATAVEASLVDTDGILALLQAANAGQGLPSAASGLAANARNSGKEDDADEDRLSTDGSQISEQDDEGGAAQARLAALGRKKAKSSAKTKAAPKASASLAVKGSAAETGTGSGAKSGGGGKNLPQCAAPRSSEKGKSGAGAPQSNPMLGLDGRALRMQESLRKEHDLAREKLTALVSFGDEYNFMDKKEFGVRTKALNALSTSVAAQVKRMESSANRGKFQEEMELFEKLAEEVKCAQELNAALSSAANTPKKIEENFDSLRACGIRAGTCFWYKLLETKLNEQILFRNLKQYVRLLSEDGREARVGH